MAIAAAVRQRWNVLTLCIVAATSLKIYPLALGLVLLVLYPVMNLFFPGLTLGEVGLAMINCVRFGAPKPVLEVADIRTQAQRA